MCPLRNKAEEVVNAASKALAAYDANETARRNWYVSGEDDDFDKYDISGILYAQSLREIRNAVRAMEEE